MKAKVRLTHIVELNVEGADEDEIWDWVYGMTPQDAIIDIYGHYSNEPHNGETFNEDILEILPEDAEVDYKII